ncbi:hypothetical protein GW920_03185 [Candidatus Falkowbacteria bacterium]|uniref:Uncharacterized protein n=1 Tax=Candidatus Falkowbacteria bacterium CG10_big_fil_rev_8_21_14_0_10_37_18 TaxID=1974562 RepID=A0A2H0V893_9BACT|nr:hypothetical protein [Candidatus Falkowbacteria bacterium]NCQ12832.1 hypothetical protein [Candidatus Falkowbacteria bacterium]OIO05777.1 MAG: hypothetical protein AUJ26_02450 [Candidatus Falkowbacteria bacterium CG1_02_37_21]PIR95326.1 MAG: hypothetical protein COT93_03190 [Candidatus Falkowbacteria bacterium CG10_big_fil_rev_8_21_14_0_10_37_18]
MLDDNFNKKQVPRPRTIPSKIKQHLSLNLHIMPQTGSSHFQKWLFLAFLLFALLVIMAILIFW